MTLEASCLDSGFRCNPKLTQSSDFLKFIKKFDENYKKHYATCNWQCLKRYITYSIGVLDDSLGCGYSERVKELISRNPDALITLQQIRVDSVFSDAYLESNNDCFEYNGLLSALIFASNPKIYGNVDLGILELDAIVYKCTVYTNLYTSLADVYVRLSEFNMAFNKMIELSVVLYFIRREVEDIIKMLDGRNIVVNLPAICGILNENRIYVNELYNSNDPKTIVMNAINYWTHEIRFEIWSVLIKIWLQTPCIYSMLRKIESMDFSLKMELLLNFDIFLSKSKSPQSVETVHSNNKCDLIDVNNNTTLDLESLKMNLPHEFVISYFFVLPFNYQCFVIEGLLFISHMCKDLNYSAFCYIYSLLYDILGIYIITLMNVLNIRNGHRNTGVSINLKNTLKTDHRSFSIPRTIFIVQNQHIFDAKLLCIPSYYNNLYLNTNSGEPSKVYTLLHGFYRFCFLLKADLESQALFTCTRACPDIYFSETIAIVDKRVGIANYKNFVGKKFPNYICASDSCKIPGTKLFVDISNGSKFASITKSIPLCNVIRAFKSSWPSKKMRKLKPQESVFSKHLNTTVKYSRHDETHVLIEGIPDNIAFSIISLLFLFDDIYSYLHYNQCAEILHYKDLLRKRQRAFVRYFLPFVPTRSTKETREISLFQKYVRNEFRENLLFSHDSISKTFRKTFIPLVDGHSPSAKRQCFRLYANRAGGTKVAFKTKKGMQKICGILRIHKLKSYLKSLLNLSKKSDVLMYKFRHTPVNKRAIFPKIVRTPNNSTLNAWETESYGISSLLSESTCIHTCMAQEYGNCRFCYRFARFKHMDHILCLLDLLAHFLFTWNSGKMYYAASYVEKHFGSDFGGQAYHIGKTFKSTQLNRELCSILAKTKGNPNKFPRVQEGTIVILDELIENTILLSLGTFFSEKYHNKLVSRLSIVQLLQGRWNLFSSLVKQSLSQNSYKTGLSEDGCSYVSNFDQSLKIILTWKVHMEILNTPLIFREFCSTMDDLHSHVDATKDDDEYLYSIEKICYPSSKLLLMDGVAHLKLSHSSNTLCPIPIIDIENDMIRVVVGSGINYFLTKSGNFIHQRQYYECSRYTKDRDDVSLLISSTRLISEAISLDPLDYKAWLYLSHCGLFSHDYYLAYKCSKRSIECFDSCVASWLVLIISTSSRTKTCAPFLVREPWEEHHSNNNTKLIGDDYLVEPAPPPFYPILWNENGDSIVANSVGGDIDTCLNIISSVGHFNNIYINSALLQLLSRTSESYNPLFPWECHFRIKLNSFLSELDNATSTIQGTHIDERYHNDIKRLVKDATDRKLLICSVAFMGSIASMFLKHKLDFRCTYHADTICCARGKTMELNFLEEEIYGWIICIEVLAQNGRHKTSLLFIPLLKMYVDAYNIARRNRSHGSMENYIGKTENVDKMKFVEQHFGHKSNIGVDLTMEFKFLEIYIKCFNTRNNKRDLEGLLSNVREEGLRQCYRKLSLLENRILVALGLYDESIQLCSQIHRLNFKSSQETDFELEHISLKAYAYALGKVQQHSKSSIVDMFANQCSLTTPVIKLDLCLNVPL